MLHPFEHLNCMAFSGIMLLRVAAGRAALCMWHCVMEKGRDSGPQPSLDALTFAHVGLAARLVGGVDPLTTEQKKILFFFFFSAKGLIWL